MNLDDLEAAGKIAPLASSRSEIAKMLSGADRWLSDARVEAISDSTRYDLAYNCILSCASAALHANDYRVTAREGHHAITLDTLSATIRIDAADLRLLQKMRHRRNLDLYQGEMPVTKPERELAINIATAILQQTRIYVAQRRDGV
jgi:hypothetical protein